MIKQIIKQILPFGIINKLVCKRQRKYIDDYLDFKQRCKQVTFDMVPNYKSVISIQGFGYSGSGALVDLLREYDNCNVFGYVDAEGSLSTQQIAAGEMDFMRHSGGIFDIEKHIEDNNVFQNDLVLHNYLKLVSSTRICQTSEKIKQLFFTLFDKISALQIWNISARSYNGHILPPGKSEILFLKELTLKEYINIVRKFVISVLNNLNFGFNKQNLVLDQFFNDLNFDYTHYSKYIDNLKYIVVFRDPRDVYTFAKTKNVPWIAHETVEDFIVWNKIMYSKFSIESSEYLVVRFEDLVLNYNLIVPKIEEYIGLSSCNHIHMLKYFDPTESKKNVSIWKDYLSEYGSDYNVIEQEFGNYCYND